MSTPRRYETARAFRAALESRLGKYAADHSVDLQRLRRQVAQASGDNGSSKEQ